MSATVSVNSNKNLMVAIYADLTTTGQSFEGADFPDKTIQTSGTGTVTLEGSNDGTNYAALNDTAGAAVSLAAASNAASVVLENPLKMRAICTGGTARVVITCSR